MVRPFAATAPLCCEALATEAVILPCSRGGGVSRGAAVGTTARGGRGREEGRSSDWGDPPGEGCGEAPGEGVGEPLTEALGDTPGDGLSASEEACDCETSRLVRGAGDRPRSPCIGLRTSAGGGEGEASLLARGGDRSPGALPAATEAGSDAPAT